MTQYDFDLFVIGGGSGGVRAARISAAHGARVGLAEERYLGGTCVNVGCVPKKLLAYSAAFGHGFEDSAGYGWKCSADEFSWSDLIANKNVEIERLNDLYRGMLNNSSVALYEARGTLTDAHTISLSTGERVTAERILIATGGWPFVPDIPGRELAITSNEAFFLPDLPKRVLVVGGGYIAVEFAGIFSGLGADVTLIHRGMAILTDFEREMGTALMVEMKAQGIKTHLHTVATKLEKVEGAIRVTCNGDLTMEVDCVLYATGRVPLSYGFGLEELGVERRANGAIVVDEDDRTSIPHIFALGDVTDQLNLTPVATAKGHALADRLFAGSTRHVSLENVPTAIFSSPPIGTVGLSEDQASDRGIKFHVFKQMFRPLKHRLTARMQQTTMKLIVENATDRVIGCHVIGDDAAEMLQGFAVAITAGATKAMFDQTIGIHPTSAEEFVTMRTPVRVQP
jgi:glutathione reductase (NADPH)